MTKLTEETTEKSVGATETSVTGEGTVRLVEETTEGEWRGRSQLHKPVNRPGQRRD